MKKFSKMILMLLLAGSIYAEPVRILGIGNSFTVDALEQHFQPLLDAQGQEAVIGYPYRGGTWLSQHDAWSSRTDTLPYNYRKFVDGQFSSTGLSTYNLTMAMENEPWDWVIIQSDHDSAGIYASYEPYMEHLIDFVHAHCSNPDVQIAFYMTWAYDSTSTYKAFSYYGKNQALMYDSIVACAQRVMSRHSDIALLIPTGTAVQNARTSYMGQRLNRDGYHLHYEHGRYIAALSWYEMLFGESATEVVYQPTTISAYCASMCKAAVHAAVQTPYAVTSLAAEYGQEEEDPIEPGTESHLRRMTVNGMNIVLTEDSVYRVPVDVARAVVDLYAYPIDANAELNITDALGADIERDVTNVGYYPLTTPAVGDSVVYTIRVISEAMGSNETIYTLILRGAAANTITYPLSSREDLEQFAAAVNSGSSAINGVLTADIEMSHTPQDCWMTPIGSDTQPFTGTFDGQGHSISGFVIYSVDNALQQLKYVGLFGYIRQASIRNLSVKGSQESYFNRYTGNTMQNNYYGILCGGMEASTISDCSVNCPIFTNVAGNVGMICGRNADVVGTAASLIERCSAVGTWRIRYTGIYGGILGYAYNITVRNCYSVCNMSLQQDRSARIGGVIGYANASSGRAVALQNCYSYGALTDDRATYGYASTNTAYIGALAAAFNGTAVSATNCWYLVNSAPAVFGQHKNYLTKQTATSATAEQFADGTVANALGTAFGQGSMYPILLSQQVVTGVEQIEKKRSVVRKKLQDGQLLIESEKRLYTPTGVRIK